MSCFFFIQLLHILYTISTYYNYNKLSPVLVLSFYFSVSVKVCEILLYLNSSAIIVKPPQWSETR